MGTNRRYGGPSERAGARSPGPEYVPVTPRARHVWVRTSVRSEVLYAGVVMGWRREHGSADGSGWFAQVAYVPVGYHDPGSLVVSWVPAENLRPAAGEAPPRGRAG